MISTCRKYRWKNDEQKKLWLGDCEVPYVVLIGDPEQDVLCRYEPPYLIVKCDDTYEGLYRKIIIAENYLLLNFDFTHIFKLDDDVVVDVDKLDQLEQFVGEDDYCGFRINCKRMDRMWPVGKVTRPEFDVPYKSPAIFDYACGGSGYVLSRKAVQMLVDEWKKAEFDEQEFVLEDVGFGQVLGRAGFRLKDIPTSLFVQHEAIK